MPITINPSIITSKAHTLSLTFCNMITEIAKRALQGLCSLYHFITDLFCWKSKQVAPLPIIPQQPATPQASQPAGAGAFPYDDQDNQQTPRSAPSSPTRAPQAAGAASGDLAKQGSDHFPIVPYSPIPKPPTNPRPRWLIPNEVLKRIFEAPLYPLLRPSIPLRTGQKTPCDLKKLQIVVYTGGLQSVGSISEPSAPTRAPQAAGAAATTPKPFLIIPDNFSAKAATPPTPTSFPQRAAEAAGAASEGLAKQASDKLAIVPYLPKQKTNTQPRPRWLIPNEVLKRIFEAPLYPLLRPSSPLRTGQNTLCDLKKLQIVVYRGGLQSVGSTSQPSAAPRSPTRAPQAAGAASGEPVEESQAPNVKARIAALQNSASNSTNRPTQSPIKLPEGSMSLQERKELLKHKSLPLINPNNSVGTTSGIVPKIAQNFEHPREEAGAAARTPPPNRRSVAARTQPNQSDSYDFVDLSAIFPYDGEDNRQTTRSAPISPIRAPQAAGAASGEPVEEALTTHLPPHAHAQTAARSAIIASSIISPIAAAAGAASSRPVANPSSNSFERLEGDLNIQKTIHDIRDLLGYDDEFSARSPLAAGAASSLSPGPISKVSRSTNTTLLNKIRNRLAHLFTLPSLALPSMGSFLDLLKKADTHSRHLMILEHAVKKTWYHVDGIQKSSQSIEWLWNLINSGQMAKSSPLFLTFGLKTGWSKLFNDIHEWPIRLLYDVLIDSKIKTKDLSFYLPVIRFLTDGLQEIADAIDEKAPGVRDTLDTISDYLTVFEELGQWITDEAKKSDPDNPIDVLSKEFTEQSRLIEALRSMYKKSDRAQSLIELENALNKLDLAAASAITYAQRCGSKKRKRQFSPIPSPKTPSSLLIEPLREDASIIANLASNCSSQKVSPFDVAKKVALKEIHDGISEGLRKTVRISVTKIASFSIPFIAGMLLPSLDKDLSNNSSLLTGAHVLLKKGVLQKTIEYTNCKAISYVSESFCTDIQEYDQSSNSYLWWIFGAQFLCAIFILLELSIILRHTKSLAIQASDLAPKPIKDKISSIKSRLEEEDPSYRVLQARRAAERAERKKQPLLLDGTGLSFF